VEKGEGIKKNVGDNAFHERKGRLPFISMKAKKTKSERITSQQSGGGGIDSGT